MNIRVIPNGFACKLEKCQAGLFLFKETLGLKTEYSDDNIYMIDSGETFWGGTVSSEERRKLIVIPCRYIVEGI